MGMSRKSRHKEIYSVKCYGPEGPPVSGCEVQSNRGGDLIVQLYTTGPVDKDVRDYSSPEVAVNVARGFTDGMITGLYNLVRWHLGSRLPAGVSYLREFTKAMFTHWLLEERATGAPPGPSHDGLINAWIGVALETPGLETLSVNVLHKIWERTRQEMINEVAMSGLKTFAGYMARAGASWSRLGTIVLKLEDTMEDRARPFVLTASYVNGVTGSRSVVMTPLSVPIFGECRVPGLRAFLFDLVRRAAQCNSVVRRLVESQEIFSSASLIPRDAHAFVRDAPALEALGIEVTLPRWWKDLKQPEIRVRTRVGAGAPKPIGIGTVLDLHTSYVVGEHELTEAEWRKFTRDNPGGLAYIGDEWVDLIHARIRAAVDASKRVDELRAQGGVTLPQAVELIRSRLPESEPSTPSPSVAALFEPGEWFGNALSAIERREYRREVLPGPRLRADLFGYQRQGVAWLSMLLDAGVGACLADDMGLGKTLQVIALIVALLRREDPGPHLIVVPPSLIANWKCEFENWARTIDLGIVYGRKAEFRHHYVTLTSYETLSRRQDLQQQEWGLVTLDEAQEIKNPKTISAQVVKRLRARMRVCLTGTPVENHFGELWSLMDFLNPGYLGARAEFVAYCENLLKGGEGLRPLRDRVRHFVLRRVKTDPEIIPDLPTKVEVTVYCWTTELQSDLYAQTYAALRDEFDKAESRARQGIAFKVLGELKRICDHPALILRDGRFDEEGSGKFIRLRELAETIAAGGDRMLIFTQYQKMTGPIAAHLEKVLGKPGTILDGTVPVKRRQELVAEFQEDDGPPFMVLTYGVGGTGFNLTAACHVILFDRWWNPAVESQAMDRAFRIGQTKGVVVHKFVCRGTLEEKIDDLIRLKYELAKSLFSADDDPDDPEAPERALSRLSSEELLSLLALDPSLTHLEDEPGADAGTPA